MNKLFYTDVLYPFQDEVLSVITQVKTGFYLTGGTVVSRVDLKHRYSDDLDLFVNWHDSYFDWCSNIIAELSSISSWQMSISMRQQYFTRLFLERRNVLLKIEFINDVKFHSGEIRQHPVLGRIDSTENILSNKLTALIGRDEPRDLADIWGLCTQLGMSIKAAISGAQQKSSGLYPPDLAQKLCTVTHKQWEQVRWVNPPDSNQYIRELFALGESLLIV